MNMNDVAVDVSKLEGGKKNLSIAQIKEVLKCLKQLTINSSNHQWAITKYFRLCKSCPCEKK